MLEIAIEELTKMLINQDIKEKEKNRVEYVTMKKTDFIKHCIKLLKLLKK